MNGLSTNNHYSRNWFIKDLDSDYDILLNDHKWDDIFKSLTANSKAIYFEGSRVNYEEGLTALVDNIAEKIFDIDSRDDGIFIKIKEANLIINRKQVEAIWLQYEHAALFFIEMLEDEPQLINMINSRSPYSDIAEVLNGACILYKGAESNVLWIQY